jgi:peptide/nickel transport system permease protein
VVRYLIRRILWAAALFVAVTAVTDLIFFVVPVDPARLSCGRAATPDCIARARVFLGLDDPVPQQYVRFLERLLVDHSLGRSFANRQSVNEIVGDAIPVTASLVGGGAVLWLLVSIPVGVLSALRPRSLLDRATMVVVLVGISAHPVWIGLLLAYAFGYRLGVVPITGYCDFFDPIDELGCGGPAQWAYHLVLPWITFTMLFAALYVRFVRAYTLEALGEDYVRTARAKGAPSWIVIRSHVLRNGLLPVVTMLGLDVGIALGGSVFTEAVFNLPGLGRTLVASVQGFDLPVTAGVVVFATGAIIVANLVVDVLYAWIDPRIRLE